MKLIEYQGKDLFRRVGIPTPNGVFATTPAEVKAFIEKNPGSWVLKSQVMMGGRGKAGGIKFADDAKQGEALAKELIGKHLVSIQNPDGETVKSLLVEEKTNIESEAYISITVDRDARRPVFICSAKGGMDVEEVAEHDPDAIVKYEVDPAIGFSPYIARSLFFAAKLPAGYGKTFPKICAGLYELFMDYGANLLEINPLVLTKEGTVIAADAKVDLDDNGLWKHPDVQAWNKAAPSDEDQEAALAIGLGMFNYKKLLDEPGEPAKFVGTIANGAGLGMGTMDAVKNAGGGATNFLDIGGGAQADLVKKSYNLVTSDPRVKAMFINIFGGITRGEQVAKGIVEALEGNDVRKVPMVIRLTGTNAEEGRKILAAAGFFPVETMDEGAAKAVALTKGEQLTVAIFLDKNSKVIVQGITGREGLFHTQKMIAYGTNIVGGVTPGKGGTKIESGQPVFNTVKDAVNATGATHSIIFVPPFAGADALYEAFDAGIEFAVCITEGIPVHEMLKVVATTKGMRIIGPNCPGVISPGKSLVGIMPSQVFKAGNVGMISRSGTLTYEIVDGLTRAGFGQSTCVGIGGDTIIGTSFVDCLREFANDPETHAVVVAGEIGGAAEEAAAEFIGAHMPNKPVVAFIGGRSAPKGARLGHAGAIISGNTGTPESKVKAFQAIGAPVADRPSDIPKLLAERLKTARV